MKTIAKWCAKFAIGYLPDIAVYAMKIATDKVGDNAKAQRIVSTLVQVSKDCTLLASVMTDGKLTETEEEQIKMRASVLAEEIGELL